MNYKIIWQPNAEFTFELEIDFILLKWNYKEVQKFQFLVIENLNRLTLNPLIGKYNSNLKVYFIIISKQTTLYYTINQNVKSVDLLVFWNNQKNPNDLKKLL